MHVFIHTKSKESVRRFYIENPDTFQKVRQFQLGFLYTKAWHFSLCAVFIYKNPDTKQKLRQFALRFYVQKP